MHTFINIYLSCFTIFYYMYCAVKETSNCNSFFDQFEISFLKQKCQGMNCLCVVTINGKKIFHEPCFKGQKNIYIYSKIFFILFQMSYKMNFLQEDITKIIINDNLPRHFRSK